MKCYDISSENELEREKKDYDDKLDQVHTQNQKMKDDHENFRNDTEKVW